MEKERVNKSHRFLDEAGDTTFYGRHKVPILGNEGVSRHFLLGMLTVNESLKEVRQKVIDLQTHVANDPYFQEIPSILKKKRKAGYFLHATDDVPEVRKAVFELINTLDCSFDAVAVKKRYDVFKALHNDSQPAFYADMVTHLLIDKVNHHENLVLNIARRSACTTHSNLERGLKNAEIIARSSCSEGLTECKMVFNIQEPTFEPIINIADYFLWALQRKLEKNEARYVNYLGVRIKSLRFLYEEG